MPTDLHTVYFMTTDGWTPASARGWMDRHGYIRIKPVHKMGNELRYRVRDPDDFKRFYTKIVGNGVHMVYGVLK